MIGPSRRVHVVSMSWLLFRLPLAFLRAPSWFDRFDFARTRREA
jgi:hypothetical protein